MWGVCKPAFSQRIWILQNHIESVCDSNVRIWEDLFISLTSCTSGAFTTLLTWCQTYKGDWSPLAQLVGMACGCGSFLIPVFPRQPVEHQGWPQACPLSTIIMKSLVFRELLAQWAKRWKKFMQSLIEQWKHNKHLSTDTWASHLPSFSNAAITTPCTDASRAQIATLQI